VNARVRATVLGLSLVVVLYVALGGLLGRAVGEGAYQQLAVFSEVLNKIQSDYVEDPDLNQVTVGALRGLLGELDPYSSYLSPREFADYQKRKASPPAGDVGLVLSKRFAMASVVTALPDSPAARAGLRTGDIIESIGEFSTREMSVEQAYQLLAGEPGTAVPVAVVRQARAEPQTFDLVRARLRPLGLVSGRLENDIGYLRIATFSPGRAAEVATALRQLRGQGMRKLVLDLRDAAGGSEDEGVAVSRLLLDKGVITFIQGQQVPRKQFAAEPGATVWDGPLTVLINAGTAGPAEIVAAAVADNRRGEVLGQRSYGVGSVQKTIVLDDGSALILVVAKYFSPSGKAIQDHAVTPTVEVSPQEDEPLPPQALVMPPSGDPVVSKAVEVLRRAAVAANKAA
jgi:carboxyl-terminal processing protease